MKYFFSKHLTLVIIGLIGLVHVSSAKDYLITDYGAVADTTTVSTKAIQKAVDECARNKGGRVVIPTGSFKTGTIVLKSNVHFYLESGAVLYGSTNIKDYIAKKPEYVSLRTQHSTVQVFYAENEENITLDGPGTIDGQGKSFKKAIGVEDEGVTRPHLIRFINCQNITVKDLTLRNSGAWMQHYLACTNLNISGLNIYNRCNNNNDALDLDGCKNATVSDIIADSEDDAIVLKSTSPRLCENITITNCVLSTHCNGIKLGTETNGGFKNISVTNCVMKPSDNKTFRIYSSPDGLAAIALEIVDGGIMENINISTITVDGATTPVFIRLANRARPYYKGQVIDNIGSIDGVSISNVRAINAGSVGCSITGIPGHRVKNIYLDNIFITQKGGCDEIAVPENEKEKDYPECTMWGNLPASGFFVRHAENVYFNNVRIDCVEPDKRPHFVFEDVINTNHQL